MSLYDDLGVSEDASEEQIKKAFKDGAKKHHPDVGGDEAKFKALAKAYDILSDEQKRERYDKTGEESNAKKQTPEEKAKVLAIQIFMNVLDRVETDNVFLFVDPSSAVLKELAEARSHAKDFIRKKKNSIKKHEFLLRRLRKKDSFLVGSINHHIKDCHDNINRAEEDIKVIDLAIKLAEENDFDLDEKPEEDNFFNIQPSYNYRNTGFF